AEHFLIVAEGAEPSLRGSAVAAGLARLDAALPDLYAALRWAVAEREPRTAVRLTGALWVFWLMRGRLAEGREMAEASLALDGAPSPERIRALVTLSFMCWFGGDVPAALAALREAFQLTEAIGDDWAWATTPLGLAAVEMFRSEEPFVPLRVEELLPSFRRAGDDWMTCQALQTLGGAAWYRGQYDRAERAFADAMALYRAAGHPTLMASLLAHGLMLALVGHLDAGAAEVDEAIARTYEAGDLVDLGLALCHRAAVARYGGHHDVARRYYAQALRTSRDAGRGWAMQWALDGLGSTEALGLGVSPARLEGCVQLLARAEAMARETGIGLPPRERQDHAKDLERARRRLGERAFRAAFARGQRLSVEEATELALALVAGGGASSV
ncbi:MAG TPA: hypothetical protein VHL78_03585, partial [Actinomycetota bacterium]|nr:hypothetical protein [Actinomycetota bacterium]